jgi:hypothetical protein
MVPRVVIKALTPTLATMNPLTKPPTVAINKPEATATGTGQFRAFIRAPVMTPLMEAIAPTDRSKLPPTSMSIMPTAKIPSNAKLRTMAEKLAKLANEEG